jgi:outer membrane autotransporter protein
LLTLTDAAQSFTVMGVPLDRDSAAVQLGLDMAIAPDIALSIGYDGGFGGRTQSNAIRGGLRLKF